MKNTKPYLLVADDDPGDVFLLRRAFRCAAVPCEIIHVQDGQEAIDYLNGVPPYDNRERHPLPSLLVLDLKMPRMNGFDVLAWLRGRPYLEHLPVVVTSSSPMQGDIETAMLLGARSYMIKPADVNMLTTFAHELYERWLAPALLHAEMLALPQSVLTQRREDSMIQKEKKGTSQKS